MSATGSVIVPAGHIVWQVECPDCGSTLAVVATYQPDAPNPKHCPICGAEAGYKVLIG